MPACCGYSSSAILNMRLHRTSKLCAVVQLMRIGSSVYAQARVILSPKRIHRIGKRIENTGFPAWSACMVPNLKFNLRDTPHRHPKTVTDAKCARVCGCYCCWLLPYRHRTYAKRHAHGWATYTNTHRTYSFGGPARMVRLTYWLLSPLSNLVVWKSFVGSVWPSVRSASLLLDKKHSIYHRREYVRLCCSMMIFYSIFTAHNRNIRIRTAFARMYRITSSSFLTTQRWFPKWYNFYTFSGSYQMI